MYIIVEGRNIHELQNNVNAQIEKGYKVTGGVAVFEDWIIKKPVFIQAMVKDE
jgi:hypothetical protein